MGVGTTYLCAGPSSGFLLQIHKTCRLGTCCTGGDWLKPAWGMENVSHPRREWLVRKTIRASGNRICWQMELVIYVDSPSSRRGDFPVTLRKPCSWTAAQRYPRRTSHQDWYVHAGLGTQHWVAASSEPTRGFQSPFLPAPCHAHEKDEAPPVMKSMVPNRMHQCRAGANWTLIQNCLLLLLDHILKVTGEARQGETNACHLTGPPGHVHTSNLVTPQEIIPLEGTGSRFSIPSS